MPSDASENVNSHPLEQYLLETFGVNAEQLHRVALFVLGRLVIDMHLVVLDAYFEGKARSLSKSDKDAWFALFDRSAQRRFFARQGSTHIAMFHREGPRDLRVLGEEEIHEPGRSASPLRDIDRDHATSSFPRAKGR
jgi:hypothetical protein